METFHYLILGVVAPLIAIVLLSIVFLLVNEKGKKGGVTLDDAGGEAGYAVRNARYQGLVDVPWPETTTVAAVFEKCCHSEGFRWAQIFGKRPVRNREPVNTGDGIKHEKLQLGDYFWIPYWQVFYDVNEFECGLVDFGHNVNTRAAIYADTKPGWQMALQGCFRQGITVVVIPTSFDEEALIDCVNETEVTTMICDSKQLNKLGAMSSSLKTVKSIVYFEDDFSAANVACLSRTDWHWRVSSFREIVRLGRNAPCPSRLPSSGDVAVIMYTKGTTGPPKGVMVTHGNLVAAATALKKSIPSLKRAEEIYLAYLPLANMFELTAELAMMFSGIRIGYSSPSTLTDNSIGLMKGIKGDASALKPTLMAADPAVIDRFQQALLSKVGARWGIAKKLFNFAYKRRLATVNGSWFGAWGMEKYIWDVLCFGRIRSVFGGQVRLVLCGGAPLSADLQHFINICMGASISQRYGLTETCATVAFTALDETNLDQVGPPLPCCYIKLVSWEKKGYRISDKPMPRGEVVVGGLNISLGYFNNPRATEKVYKVDEKGMRWFYTGDIGRFHPDGCLEIMGRKRELNMKEGKAAPNSCNFLDNVMLDHMMVVDASQGS